MKRSLFAATLLASVFAAACASNEQTETAQAAPTQQASQQAASPPATPPAPAANRTDYSKAENWLCKPGLANNPCEVNIDATVINIDGSTTLETFKADPNAPIDCFYVYPTVSLDPMTYSDLKPGPEEFNVVKAQLARLGSACRLYAPMYRQFSLGALRARMSGGAAVPVNGAPADPNNDIDDAWAHYLAHDNKGRGVVILGHSQGSGQIMRLIAAKVDGQPVQKQLVSAIVLGSSVQVPEGKDVGGTFKSIPTCKSASQTGCVISYSTFRDTIPASSTAMFGAGRPGQEAVCTNPAALGGGAAQAKAYFSNADREWVKGKTISTPFVVLPGVTTIECVKRGSHHYLEARFKADPADPRTDDPGTDIMGADGKPDAGWGLHLMDANIAMGDLVDVVKAQSTAWKAANP